ncbi:MAG: ABC transporter substrate-binding protein [Desulfobacterales bacterium]|nr:MAG: ABC transporter substrate-binding protein [Desulfobacterales bacterium]
MTALGYREGENIIYDFQKTNNDLTAEKRILQKFVADKVDLIFTFPTEVSLAAKAATRGTDIAVVFANANIEGVDLVDSVREPGGNITGVRYPGPDLAIKRFEIMLEFAPQAKRIGIPYQQGYPIIASQLDVLYTAVKSSGIALVEVPAKDAADLQTALNARAQSGGVGIDAMLMIADPLAVNPDAFAVLGEFAAQHKIPCGGALMTVGGYRTVFGVSTDNAAVGQQAASLVDKILKGAPAGSIPVISAESVLKIGYRAAQQLGLPVSEGLLSKADEIIR